MRSSVLALLLLAAACARSTSGTPGPGPSGGVDAAGGGGGGGGGQVPDAARVTIDAPATTGDAAGCKPANILHGDGHHNPGMDCMGGCHNHGFSVAGTLYMPDGVTPANDATVTIVDANHNAQDLAVGWNGNFFSYLPVAYPITISASLCPNTQMMVTQPTAGGCNATGCHAPGGAQGVAHL